MISGCADSNDTIHNNTVSPVPTETSIENIIKTEQEIQLEVGAIISSFYKALITETVDMDNAEQRLEEIIGKDNIDEFRTAASPFDAVQELPTETLTELADYYKSVDVTSSFFDYSNMTDAEITLLSIFNMIYSNLLFIPTIDNNHTPIITVNTDNITVVNNNKASISQGNVKYVLGDIDYSEYLIGGLDSLVLNKNDDEWKISGKAAHDVYMAMYSQETPDAP